MIGNCRTFGNCSMFKQKRIFLKISRELKNNNFMIGIEFNLILELKCLKEKLL